jgi:YHS domain-containing protein
MAVSHANLWASFVFVDETGNIFLSRPSLPERPAACRGEEICDVKTATIDPVCGHEVVTSTEPGLAYRGSCYFFCCEDCRRRFQRDPGEFTVSEGEELAELPSGLEMPCSAPEVPSSDPQYLPLLLVVGFLILVVLITWSAWP